MRVHILGMPHTQLTGDYLRCAYTQKIVKLCDMLINEGLEVTVYASEDNETKAKLVTCITKAEQAECGFHGPSDYNSMVWDNTKPIWTVFHAKVIDNLSTNVKAGDIIGTFAGLCDEPIFKAFPQCRFVELGIGYAGIIPNAFHIFESWAWLHTVMGQIHGAYQADGVFYDTVIPNFFEKKDFPLSYEQENYYLFVGRMIYRKGITLINDMAKRMPSTKFLFAGQGAEQNDNKIMCEDGTSLEGDNLEYIGTVNAKQRGRLMSHAQALICPTLYIGPFEGVHIESLMCGTPILTTPFGVFSESYKHGWHGFKCRTIKEFVEGAEKVKDLNRNLIRIFAQNTYSTDVIAKQYIDYFNLLDGLSRGGFYE